jgi:hypothetical protein
VSATGGSGGGANPGGEGGESAMAAGNGVSGSGNVNVTVTARGGSGGTGGYGANGVMGASASLDNAAGGSTTGQLTLIQNAYGGAGGEAVFNPANVGAAAPGGSASSILGIHDMAAANVSATAYANGGSGGSNENGSVAGAAGSTTASTTLVGVGGAFGVSTAIGDDGRHGSRQCDLLYRVGHCHSSRRFRRLIVRRCGRRGRRGNRGEHSVLERLDEREFERDSSGRHGRQRNRPRQCGRRRRSLECDRVGRFDRRRLRSGFSIG